jgi:hypothetical protein
MYPPTTSPSSPHQLFPPEDTPPPLKLETGTNVLTWIISGYPLSHQTPAWKLTKICIVCSREIS